MDKKFFNRPKRIEAPDTTNVSYLDEYPRITERLRLRRLAQARPLGQASILHFDPALRDRDQLRQLMEQPPQDYPDSSA